MAVVGDIVLGMVVAVDAVAVVAVDIGAVAVVAELAGGPVVVCIVGLVVDKVVAGAVLVGFEVE